MNLFNDEVSDEYMLWRKANPSNFSWRNFLNIKANFDTALGFGKFFCPDVVIVEDCFLLKDTYSEERYKKWKNSCDCKEDIEKMMNMYVVRDFFHINSDNVKREKVDALADIIVYFWSLCFKERYPNRSIDVMIIMEEDGEKIVTVYDKRLLQKENNSVY